MLPGGGARQMVKQHDGVIVKASVKVDWKA